MVRQKIIHCGKGTKTRYREVDISLIVGAKKNGQRELKKNKSLPKQERLNFKNARRHLNQLVKSNFSDYDLRIDLTYCDEYLPDSLEKALKYFNSYINKVNRERKKRKLAKAKWICVDEGFGKEGRPHHHLLISGGLDRDTMERLWYTGRGRYAKSLGLVKAENLHFNNEGIEGLVKYITKQSLKEYKDTRTKGQLSLADVDKSDITMGDLISDEVTNGRRRWRQSKNLIQPHERIKSNAYSRKQIMKLVMSPPDCENTKRFFEHRYKGYVVDTCRYVYNDVIGIWSIYLTMHRKQGADALASNEKVSQSA